MARGARKEGLSRRHRFVGRGSFAAALGRRRKKRTEAIVLYVAPGREGLSRLGLVVSKRLTRRCVDRNRLKRLVREAFRRHGVKRAGLDMVLVPRKTFSRAGAAAWVAQVRQLLDRAAEE